MMRPGRMGDCAIDQIPTQSDADELGDGGALTRQEWVRANFTQIFGTSAADLQARGTDPRQYARDHRDQIRRFAQMQRRHGIAVPDARPSGANPTAGGNGPYGNGPYGYGPRNGLANRGYRYGGAGLGFRSRGGAWVGILLVLLALRFLLVASFAGTHAALFWVLGIGGILLVARVFLFSWLRRRRGNRRW
jgi:hypothetical protein